MTNLRNPTGATVDAPEELLNVLTSMYQAIKELQGAANVPGVQLLGSLMADPGVPPAGTVYIYTLAGSLYARTATQRTLLAT